jgi:hypothetical protein
MTHDPKENGEVSDDALPRQLRDALQRLDGPSINVPAELDDRILAEARAGFRRRVRFRPAVRWAAAVAAAAAVIAIISGIWIQTHRLSSRSVAVAIPGHVIPAIPGDMNGDGKVDMLDAYLLAREIAPGGPANLNHDINGDGVVDQRDVDAIANSAVRVGGANP